MPTLEWIGKGKVVNHHLEVPYRVLEEHCGNRSNLEKSIVNRRKAVYNTSPEWKKAA